MSSRYFAAGASALALLITPAAALADAGGVSGGPGYSPPPAVADNCNAGHGAFGAFGGKYNNLGINDLGTNGAPGAANPHAPGAGGLTTGEVNSAASAACRAQ